MRPITATATFTVTDAHDFTVTVDGQPATAEGSLYTLPADNVSHEVVAVDVAGNRTTVTVSVYRTYTVTPPTGTGFTFTGETTVRHGQDYRFRVDIAPGYSKLPDYSLLVNGQTPGGMGDVDFDECLIPSVEGDLTITVTGVADITPPEAALTIAGNPFRQFLNTVTFGLFFKSTQTVTVTVSDLGSGVDTAAWMLSDTVFASQDAITGSWTDLSLTDGSGSFSIQPGQKGYAYLRVTDRAGNITVLNSDGVVVYTDASGGYPGRSPMLSAADRMSPSTSPSTATPSPACSWRTARLPGGLRRRRGRHRDPACRHAAGAGRRGLRPVRHLRPPGRGLQRPL